MAFDLQHVLFSFWSVFHTFELNSLYGFGSSSSSSSRSSSSSSSRRVASSLWTLPSSHFPFRLKLLVPSCFRPCLIVVPWLLHTISKYVANVFKLNLQFMKRVQLTILLKYNKSTLLYTSCVEIVQTEESERFLTHNFLSRVCH